MADMNTLITAFENARKAGDEAAAKRLAQAIKSMQQQQQGSQQDGAFAFGVDKAQQMAGKGIEVIGDLVGSDSVKDFGSDIVAQQEKDIKAGGYQPTYTGSLTDNYKQGGLDGAVGWLVEKTAENAASGGFAIAGTGLSAAVALFSTPVALAIGAGTLVTSGVMGAGETALEMEDKTGKYDPKVAAGVGVLVGILDKFGAGKVIPTDKLASMTGKELIGELMDKGFVDAAKAVGSRISKSTITEGATETAQEGAIMAGTAATGGKYTGGEIVDRSIDAFALGGTMGGGTTTAIETGKGAVKAGKATTRLFSPSDSNPTDPEAAADLAQRLNNIAEENGYDLNDIDKTSTKGARETVDKAHVQLSEELKQVAKDLKNRLNITDTDELSVVLNKVMASAGQREARNKTKNTVGKQEMDAVQKLTGDTAEGQRMMSIMRQLNELTEIHNDGYQGGLSKITDQFAPFGTNIGYDRGAIATERLLRPLVSGGAAVQTGGASLIGQAAIAGAGRAIDSMTGRRSRVRRYIEQNKNELGIEQGNEPSLRQAGIDEAAQLEQERIDAEQQGQARQEQREQLNLDLARRNAPPTPGSPQDTMEDGTGMDRNGVARVIKILERINTNPILTKAIKSYRESIAKGGRVSDLSILIRAVNAVADANPDIDALRVREPNRNRQVEQTQLDARIEQGKRDNQAFNSQLAKALNDDKSVDPQTKAVGMAALSKLRLDLGQTPLATAKSYLDEANAKAKNPLAIQAYVQPYVDRVAQQQPSETEETIEQFVELRSPKEAPPKRQHRQIGEELMKEQAQRYGRDLDPYNDAGDFEAVVDAMTNEAQLQFDKTPDAAHWYDEDIRKALETTATVIPQINESSENRQLFLILAALTSVGHKPRINWRYAGALALHYFNSGELGEIGSVYSEKRGTSEQRLVNPTTGKLFGLKAASIEPGLRILRHMLETKGVQDTLDWINSDKTKAEIDAMRKEAGYGPQSKIKGGKNAVVKGIQMFGPKVGPFYLNLNGIHEVTVDLWASRTVRRHTGGLLDTTFDPNNKKAADSGLVDAPSELERPTMKELFTRVGNNLDVTPQSAQAILWAYEQELYNDLGANLIYEKFSEGAEIFQEKDAVAYAERAMGASTGQDRGRTPNASKPRASNINRQRQLSLDFDEQRGNPNQGRSTLSKQVGSRPADPAEVRDAKTITDPLFDIGKPGSVYENGIRDIETAKKLAAALGAALYIAPNKSSLAKVFAKRSMGEGFTMGAAQMTKDPRELATDRRTFKKHNAIIGLLDVYKNPKNPDEQVTPLQLLWASLHELGHVLEGRFVPGKNTTRKSPKYLKASNKTEASNDSIYENTFRQAIASIMDAAGGINIKGTNKQDAQAILDEIIRFQRNGALSMLGENLPARGDYDLFNEAIDEAEVAGDLQKARRFELQLIKAEDTYFQTPNELAADLIGFYLIDPQRAKKEMPKATKLVRDILNQGDGTVKFFSMPFAALVAAIFANMLVADGEEEEKRGLLSLGQGALSA